MKNILHISDIHVSTTPEKGMGEHALNKLLLSLIEDLKTLPNIDTIFITGDIANTGITSEYDLFHKSFLSPLLTALGINCSQVFIVPGNHDSYRGAWKKSDQLMKFFKKRMRI